MIEEAYEVCEAIDKKDFGNLKEKLWREIEHNASLQSAPCLLYKDMGLLGRVLRDEAQGNVDEIIVNGEKKFAHVTDFVNRLYVTDKPSVALYRGVVPIFEYYGIENEIEQALDRKVWLRSGAYLVIEHTKADNQRRRGHADFRGQKV